MYPASTSSASALKATSKAYAEEFKFQWAIDVGSPRILTNGASGIVISSPLFSGGNTYKYSWRLDFSIFPPHNHKLRLTLVKAGKTDSSTDGKLKAFVIASYRGPPETAAGVEELKRNTNPYYELMKCGSSVDTGIDFSKVHVGNNCYIPNNILTLYCKVFIYLGTEHSDVAPAVVNSSTAVVKSLQTVLQSGDLSDVQIVTSTKTIPAHKIILAARSPVFAAMFRSNMQEAKNSSVEIKDFDTNVVDAMMEFIYSGQTQISTSKFNSADLLRISNKYELLDLKSDVEKLLKATLKLENAVELLILAYLHNCDALKMTATEFINVHKTQLSGTEAFKKLGSGSHPGILKELFMSTYKKNMCETESFMTLAQTHPEMVMQLYLAT